MTFLMQRIYFVINNDKLKKTELKEIFFNYLLVYKLTIQRQKKIFLYLHAFVMIKRERKETSDELAIKLRNKK